MVGVLLAEDNALFMDYLSKLVRWEEYGFELVATAIDGENAWLDFQKYSPGIVITDIEMPVLSGIDLIRKINETAPETVVMILSGYSEFQYAQAALQLKVFDYVLKHNVDRQMLVEKLMAAKTQLNQKRSEQRVLSEEVLKALYKNQGVDSHILARLRADRYCWIHVEQNHILPVMGAASGITTEEVEEVALKDAFYQCCPGHSILVKTDPYRYLALVQGGQELLPLCYRLKTALETALGQRFSIVCSTEARSAAPCVEDYHFVAPLLSQLHFFPVSTVMDSNQLQKRGSPSPPTDLREVGQRLGSNNVLLLLDQFFMSLMVSKDYDAFCTLTEVFLSDLQRYQHSIVSADTGKIFSLNHSGASLYWQDVFSVFQWLKQQYQELHRMLDGQSNVSDSGLVKQAISYIVGHYMDPDLSLDSIAAALQISVSRLNVTFKNETGRTVWKVIVKTRMEKAKELLQQQNTPVSDICQQVGFRSLSYFSKVFRDTYGVSPQEYRRRGSHL